METLAKIIGLVVVSAIGIVWMDASDKEKARSYSNDEWKSMTPAQRREVHAARHRLKSR